MSKNVIVGQSGGPTSVINSSLAGVFCGGIKEGKVYGMIHGIQGFIDGNYVDMSEYVKSDMDVELLKMTPSSWLGSCRFKMPAVGTDDALYEKIFDRFKELDIGTCIYIGGNDSMDTIAKLDTYGKKVGSDIRFIGCPKTIDNDLAGTDHTPGFGSAAKYIASSMKEIIRDTYCQQYAKGMVLVCEIMGRDAGWLTASAVLCKDEDCIGPDLVYLPEGTFDLDYFDKRVEEIIKEKDVAVVAVSEGIRTADGKYVCELGDSSDYVDAFGHKQLSGTALFLANHCSGKFGCKARAVEFSILQRAAAHITSATDINEAFQAGVCAVKAASEGKTGYMVSFERPCASPYRFSTGLVDVHNVANAVHTVPKEWITEDGTYLTDDFRKYALPLIQGEIPTVMVNGIPKHLGAPKGMYA